MIWPGGPLPPPLPSRLGIMYFHPRDCSPEPLSLPWGPVHAKQHRRKLSSCFVLLAFMPLMFREHLGSLGQVLSDPVSH